MFDSTAEALLLDAGHTATGPGDTDLVLPDIEDDFTVVHSFSFMSANEAEFEDGPSGCPEAAGYVIDAEQRIELTLGNQVVEGRNHVRFFVADQQPLTGELVEQLGVSGLTTTLLDAVADATFGGPRCGPDEYYMGPDPDLNPWTDIRERAWLSLRRETCDEWTTGTVFQGTVASMNLGNTTESTASTRGTP